MENKTFKYGEFETEIDISDYNFLELFDEADKTRIENFERLESLPESDYVEKLKQTAHAITDYFDGIFGDGTSDLMFGDKITSLNTLIEAFAEFNQLTGEQASHIPTKIEAIKKQTADRKRNQKARR